MFYSIGYRNLEDVRDIDVIKEHALKRTAYETEKSILSDNKRIKFTLL